MKLTKEEAIRLYRQMWSDMLKELGIDPSSSDRIKYKRRWCETHGYEIANDCFLCEYSDQEGLGCDQCIIDWSQLHNGYTECYPSYLFCVLNRILALPERK